MKYKVYIIENGKTDKVYIGITERSLEDRFANHKHSSKTKDTHLYRAMRKIGIENFTIRVIDTAKNREELNKKEMYWISHYNSYEYGYNSTLGGDGNRTVLQTDEEIINLYYKLKSSSKVAKHFSIGENTVLRVLKANEINLIGSGYEAAKRITSEEAVNAYKETRSIQKAADLLGVSGQTVSRKLKEIGFETYEYGLNENEELDLIKRYKESNLSMTRFGEINGVNRKTLSNIIYKHGEVPRKRGSHLSPVKATVNGKDTYFNSKTECAERLIELNMTRSKSSKTVIDGINRAINLKVPYYGITFENV